MIFAPDASVVVAGNGPSLREADPARIDPAAPVLRMNSFFFETAYHLGRRVDLVHIGGDRRVLPFYLRTLLGQIRTGAYEVGAWTCHVDRVEPVARRRLPLPFVPFRLRDRGVERLLAEAIDTYGKQPTTGLYAILNAHGHGAGEIRLAGLDLYAASERYAYQVGRNVRDLMGPDFGRRGHDPRLHDPDLDRYLIDALQQRDDLRIYRLARGSPLAGMLDLAPETPAASPPPEVKESPVTDWDRGGPFYPIALLKLLRRARRLQMRLMGKSLDW